MNRQVLARGVLEFLAQLLDINLADVKQLARIASRLPGGVNANRLSNHFVRIVQNVRNVFRLAVILDLFK
ncbi:hypothetical protein ADM99_14640 [Leptolinea tardivitalis]|uniref:Uncharacterized protein n=1 Tax=Leptolinea tardivitalis TaxID=229920 RepID=A0A0P6WWE7_9CHLR|nr:hypothetical protein ADM99_14640 [Leptolinea tardivitalis]